MIAWLAETAGSLKAGFRGTGKSQVWLAIVVLFCVSLLLRLPGYYTGHPLWLDELWRAVLILDPAYWHDYFFVHSVGAAITSLGYALFIKCLALFGISPDILRLSSLIPGVLSALMAFFITRKAGGDVALALLAGLIFALNRYFIGYSNEMKPYAFEVLLHMAGLYAWLTLLLAPQPTVRTWLLYFSVLLFIVFSTTTVVFQLPAAGLTLFTRFLIDRRGEGGSKNLAYCVAVFAAIGAVVAGLYFIAWRHGSSGDMLSIWADGFSQSGSYPHFLGSALMQMWGAGLDTVYAVRMQVKLALVLLAAILAWVVVSRRALETPTAYILLFYLTLIATLCLLNFAKLWPLGALRVNLFLFGYFIMFPFLLSAQLPFSGAVARLCLVGGGLLLLWHVHSVAAALPTMGAPVERSDLVIQDFSADGPIGRAILADCPKQKTLVIADNYMAAAVSYFTQYDAAHRQSAALLKGPCVKYGRYTEAYLQPNETARALSKILPGASHAWFIHSHLGEPDVAALRRIAERYGRVARVKNYEGAGYFELIMPGR